MQSSTMTDWMHNLRDNVEGDMRRIKKSLKDLPNMLKGNSAKGECYYGDISGDFNFHFTFRLEGNGFFQTGVLVAQACVKKADGSPGHQLPLACSWHRRVGETLVQIPSIESNAYQISADDIGTSVCVLARPADGETDGWTGEAHGEIGPFQLDPSTRKLLDNAIGARGTIFPVQSHMEGGHTQDCKLQVLESEMKFIIPGPADRNNKEIVAYYKADYPKVIIHPLDTTKFQLEMSEQKKLNLSALGRTSRDLIALTIRCFQARQYVATTFVLDQLFQNPAVPGKSGPSQNSRTGRCGWIISLLEWFIVRVRCLYR
jgi:hypothetical protein